MDPAVTLTLCNRLASLYACRTSPDLAQQVHTLRYRSNGSVTSLRRAFRCNCGRCCRQGKGASWRALCQGGVRFWSLLDDYGTVICVTEVLVRLGSGRTAQLGPKCGARRVKLELSVSLRNSLKKPASRPSCHKLINMCIWC